MFQEIHTAASELPCITLPSQLLQLNSTTTAASQSPQTPRRKRKYSEDEDYIPPTESKISRFTFDDSSSDSEYEKPAKPARRGRPPKKAGAISTVSNGEGGKYREMRDKNNEASRKSRMKRKVKEMGLEQEAEELTNRNIKLKARVSQLEKTVSNFRTNVMSLLMKK